MDSPARNTTWLREELLHLLSLSGTLAGLCITGVTLFHTVLAASALLFLLCTYAIFIALRTRRERLAVILEKVADTLFLLALTGMVVAGFVMVYAVW